MDAFSPCRPCLSPGWRAACADWSATTTGWYVGSSRSRGALGVDIRRRAHRARSLHVFFSGIGCNFLS